MRAVLCGLVGRRVWLRACVAASVCRESVWRLRLLMHIPISRLLARLIRARSPGECVHAGTQGKVESAEIKLITTQSQSEGECHMEPTCLEQQLLPCRRSTSQQRTWLDVM